MKVEVRQLLERKASLVTKAREIAERDDGGSAESQKSIADIMADIEKIDARVTELESQRDDEPPKEENDDEPPAEKDGDKDEGRSLILRKLQAIEERMKQSAGRQSAASLGGSDIQSRAASAKYHAAYFEQYLRGREIPAEYRDLTVTGGDGASNLITPVKLHEGIVTKLNNLLFMRKFADITTLTDAVSLGNPQLTADIQQASWGGEATVATADTTMAVVRRDLSPILLSNIVKATWKELQLGASIVEKLISDRTSLSFAYAEESAYLTGDGSGHPLGVFTASASGISTARDVTAADTSTHTFTADDILKTIGSIPQQYFERPSFGMIVNRNYWTKMLLLKDGDGHYLWQVGGAMGGQATPFAENIRGIKVMRSEYAPYNGTPAAGQYILCVGDFSYYRIAETPFVFQRLNELYAASGKVGFLAYKFVDGSPVLESAFARLITG
ncbi:MAG: phage major capsid protein [Planctomycetes bacterium]|nr:phage major capsid protein [Planctomycetota bacterium]